MKPKMILFDYGETLVHELGFEPLLGNQAILDFATYIPDGITAETIQEEANCMKGDISDQFCYQHKDAQMIEIPAAMFQRYLYESVGVSLPEMEDYLLNQRLEELFWDHCSVGVPNPDVEKMLHSLKRLKIRTGVISNITISGACLKRRLDRLLPEHDFEFVISSCDYLFRKPHPRIFQLACTKSGLKPSDIWFCGDNPICDVEGASKVGMRSILFSDQKQQDLELEKIRIQSWNQLVELIEESY